MNTASKPTPQARNHGVDDYTTPAQLHLVLAPTTTLLRGFRSQKEMMGYRRMIYSINKQGEYRYRTIRAESEMWALIIWRMV